MIDKIQENKYLDINIRFYFFFNIFHFQFRDRNQFGAFKLKHLTYRYVLTNLINKSYSHKFVDNLTFPKILNEIINNFNFNTEIKFLMPSDIAQNLGLTI